MQNVVTSVEGRTLVIRVELDADGRRSASGKTIVIASTRGNAAIADSDGNQYMMGLNVYKKA